MLLLALLLLLVLLVPRVLLFVFVHACASACVRAREEALWYQLTSKSRQFSGSSSFPTPLYASRISSLPPSPDASHPQSKAKPPYYLQMVRAGC